MCYYTSNIIISYYTLFSVFIIRYSQLEQYVKLFAGGLHQLLFHNQSKSMMAAVCSVCRLEWYVTDLACILLGIPTVSGSLIVKEIK